MLFAFEFEYLLFKLIKIKREAQEDGENGVIFRVIFLGKQQ